MNPRRSSALGLVLSLAFIAQSQNDAQGLEPFQNVKHVHEATRSIRLVENSRIDGLRATSGGKFVIAQEQASNGQELVVLDGQTGKTLHVLESEVHMLLFDRPFVIAADERSVIYVSYKNGLELIAAEIETGRRLWSWIKPADLETSGNFRFSTDGRTATLPIGTKATLVWNLATGQSRTQSLESLPDSDGVGVVPIPGRDEFLTIRTKILPGRARQATAAVLDNHLNTFRDLFTVEDGISCLPLQEGRRSLFLHAGNPKYRWGAAELWDLVEVKRLARHEFGKSLDCTEGVSGDGRRLFLIDANQIVQWDLQNGRAAATFHGDRVYHSTRDGRTLVTTLVVENEEQQQRTSHLLFYDVSAAVGAEVEPTTSPSK